MEGRTEIPNQAGFCSVMLNVTKSLDQIWPKGRFFPFNLPYRQCTTTHHYTFHYLERMDTKNNSFIQQTSLTR